MPRFTPCAKRLFPVTLTIHKNFFALWEFPIDLGEIVQGRVATFRMYISENDMLQSPPPPPALPHALGHLLLILVPSILPVTCGSGCYLIGREMRFVVLILGLLIFASQKARPKISKNNWDWCFQAFLNHATVELTLRPYFIQKSLFETWNEHWKLERPISHFIFVFVD